MTPKIITLEATIASGKTTLVNILRKKNNKIFSSVYEEPVDQIINTYGTNLLDLFYKDKERYGYTMQQRFFRQRVKQIEEMVIKHSSENKPLLFERSWHTDHHCFAKMLNESGDIKDFEYGDMKDWFSWLVESKNSKVPKIDGCIYLQCDPNISYKRLQKRYERKNEENEISLEYLEQLHKKHEQLYNSKNSPLITNGNTKIKVININKDFVQNKNFQNKILQEIEDFTQNI